MADTEQLPFSVRRIQYQLDMANADLRRCSAENEQLRAVVKAAVALLEAEDKEKSIERRPISVLMARRELAAAINTFSTAGAKELA